MAKTWHIHIKGQVQGVGFRPYVYKKAKEFELKGWVNNAIDGVHCEFNAEEKTAKAFCQSLINYAPELSEITEHKLDETQNQSFQSFQIIHSKAEGKANLLLTPDFAMCDDCRNELFVEKNRRYNYPFITCTNCGPRYSIIEKLPYDRETTTMEKFGMCEPCKSEYENPLDRRYYSQTNSCHSCGISMSLYDGKQNLLLSKPDDIIPEIHKLWGEGKIVAIKGIGGYLLTCDASHKKVIELLRKRKQRPAKPFALMYPNVELVEKDLEMGDKEKAMLTGAVSPIIISAIKEHLVSGIRQPPTGICLQEIAPGLSRLGVMIPYTPLYALLLESFARPIIATSDNISNSPIIYNDEKALGELIQIADYVLTNNRAIAVPQDDSVVTFTPEKRQKIIYRRSRGLAPTYINPRLKLSDETVLATGAMLKSTFTYAHQKNMFISQYVGDLDHFDTQQHYKHMVEHFFELFDERPDILLADKHPDYFSTRFAEELSREFDVPLKKYQHHKAHFGAVLGEHNLIDSNEPILGVIWDGTGLGDDSQIWGGEFFKYENYTFNRCAHFSYFDFIAGDKMPREPRISALAATHDIKDAEPLLQEKFSDLEWKNYHTLLQKPGNLQTSSVGRLFDAVSSLLGLKGRQSYEGEAAMLLENEARKHVQQHGLAFSAGYVSALANEQISTRKILEGVVGDIQKGVGQEIIAVKFHYSLVEIIKAVARKYQTKKIAFSGGVFQNALLVDIILERLGESYDLYFHEKLSPNDENISFGQLMCHTIKKIGGVHF